MPQNFLTVLSNVSLTILDKHFNVWHTNAVLFGIAELQNEPLNIQPTLLFIATGPLSLLTTSFSMKSHNCLI